MQKSMTFFQRALLAFAVASGALGASSPATAADGGFVRLEWEYWDEPCDGDCRIGAFAGNYVNTGFGRIVRDPVLPWDWSYDDDDHFVAVHASRTLLSVGKAVKIEPEIGVGKRFGDQDETEIWTAVFVRNTKFPWNRWLVTTAALGFGLNYATGVSAKEQARGGPAGGDRLLGYVAPEVTFALPNHPNAELALRLHHRSGAYGLVSETKGGAQYGTVGLNFKF